MHGVARQSKVYMCGFHVLNNWADKYQLFIHFMFLPSMGSSTAHFLGQKQTTKFPIEFNINIYSLRIRL